MRFLLGVPALVLLVLFALSNKQPTRLYLWPTDITLDAPLSLAVLVASAVFFLAGAFMTWGTSLSMRARARRAEEQVRQLRTQVRTLQARPVAEPRIIPPAKSQQAGNAPGLPPSRPLPALSSNRA
ncbi:MAG: LapA family protein [Janthinobacterium lividum]